MGKKSGASKKEKKASKKKTAEEKDERMITMEALEEMSSSDGEEMPPEAEWDADALALKEAINSGALDKLLKNIKKKEREDSEEASFEEVDLEEESDQSAEDEDDETKEKSKTKQAELDSQSGSEEESGSDDSGSEDGEDYPNEQKVDVGGDVDDSENDDDDDDDEVDDDEEEEDDDEGDNEEVTLEKMNSISSKALHIVTEDLRAEKKGWAWAETFDCVSEKPLPFAVPGNDASKDGAGEHDVNIHDDLKREVAFYDMALEAVAQARGKCTEAGIPFSRPDDFFAEMVKTDDHMAKVKDRLIFENKKIEAVTQRKSNKEQKLRAKEAQSNKLAEKAKRKREHFKSLEDWSQTAASKRDRLLEDDGGRQVPNKKRMFADKKFGFGGKKGRFKQTDRKSLNDMSDYNPRGNFAGGMKKTSAGASGGSGNKRQGKRARDAKRAKR